MFSDRFEGRETPFICLKARISQIFFAPHICLLIIGIIKLQLFKLSLDSNFQILSNIALTTCASIQNFATTARNLQAAYITYLDSVFIRILLHMTNIFLDSIILVCTLLKNIIVFMIELTIGTWACLSVLLFNSLAVFALDVCQTLIDWVNTAIDDAISAVNKSLAALSKVVNSVSGLINSITSLISNTSSSISDIQLSLTGIQNMTIPSSISDNIESLKGKLPSYDSIMNETSSLISMPFELIEDEMGSFKSTVSVKISNLTHNSTLTANQTFCDTAQINHIVGTGEKAVKILINVFSAAMGLTIVALLIYYVYATVKSWRRMEFACSINEQYPLVSRDIEIMNLANLTSCGSVQLYLQTIVQKQFARNIQFCWWLNYAFSKRLSIILEIGLFGILIAILELIVYSGFAKIVKQLTRVFTQETLSLSGQAMVDLESWQASANVRITTVENYANDQVLNWLRTGSEAVNGTLTSVMTKVNSALMDALGDSKLEDLASGVVNCTIGNKVTKIEKGLTWIYMKSNLTLPRLASANSTSVSSLVIQSSDQLSKTGAEILSMVRKQILIELGISCGFLGLWIIVSAISFVYVFWYAEMKDNKSINFSEKS